MLSVGTLGSGGRRAVGCRQACLAGLLLACLWRGRWLPALGEKPAVGHPGPLVVWEHLCAHGAWGGVGAGRSLCLLIHMDFTAAPPPQTGDTKTAEDQRL